ncbi:MAG: FAD-linked oxidase, partial [Mesorhizobium sp.]
MNAMSFTTLEGGKTTLDAAALDALSARIRGTALREGDAAYDDMRSIWNSMIDRRPALIV